jgi:putative DNA primase/helicase
LILRRYCIETIQSLLDGVLAEEVWKRWAKSLARGVIEEMQYFAQADTAIDLSRMDTDPWLFNCANGTIDLRTGALRTYRREDLNTKMSPVAYDSMAPAPRFEQFIQEIFAPHLELIPYVQKLIGYAMTAETREAVLPIFYGPSGANGKSTLLKVFRYVMGDYGVDANSSWFMRANFNNGENAAPGLFSLRGSRFAYVSELESGRQLNEALIKNMTGGDWITTRTLYGKPISFPPTFKIFIATNHLPPLKRAGSAFWRRVKPIPFDVHFPESKQDKELPAKLAAEYPGILNWMIRGQRRWYAEGLGELPHSSRVLLHEYRAAVEPLTDFIATRLVIDSSLGVRKRDVFAAYLDWWGRVVKSQHEPGTAPRPLAPTEFYDVLAQSIPSITIGKLHGVMGFRGVGLKGARPPRPAGMSQETYDALYGDDA